MQYVRTLRFVTFILLTIGLVSGAAIAAGPRPADEVFRLAVQLDDEVGIELNWSIAPGHYLYRERIAATLNGKPLKITPAHGEVKDDPTFGLTEVYHASATATIAAGDIPTHGKIQVTYQGCAENVLCYPPITKAIDLETLAVTDPDEAGERNSVAARPAINYEVKETTLSPTAGHDAESVSLDGGYIPMLDRKSVV